MSDFRTKLTGSGTGQIVSKGPLEEVNNVKVITLAVSFARRRQDPKGGLITEEDCVHIKFWSTGAEIINDTAKINQYIFVEVEVRCKNKLEVKAQHFELL